MIISNILAQLGPSYILQDDIGQNYFLHHLHGALEYHESAGQYTKCILH